jgi:hypothetical protein
MSQQFRVGQKVILKPATIEYVDSNALLVSFEDQSYNSWIKKAVVDTVIPDPIKIGDYALLRDNPLGEPLLVKGIDKDLNIYWLFRPSNHSYFTRKNHEIVLFCKP